MQNQRNIAQAKKSTFTNQLTPTTPNRHSFSVCVSSKSSVCFVFVFRLSQHAKAVVGSTKTAGRTQNLPLRADASGALQSKLQSSGAERHLAPRGVAATRATRRVAVSQLTTQFPSTPVFVRAPREIISDKLIVYRFDFLLRRGARGLERTGLRPARPRLRRGGAPTGRFISLAGEKQSLPARLVLACRKRNRLCPRGNSRWQPEILQKNRKNPQSSSKKSRRKTAKTPPKTRLKLRLRNKIAPREHFLDYPHAKNDTEITQKSRNTTQKEHF